MTPAAIERFAVKFIAYAAAKTSAGQSHTSLHLIDYGRGAPYIARAVSQSVGERISPYPERAGF